MGERVRKPNILNIPGNDYWKNRLRCHGCDFPLIPPVYYCQNSGGLHPLCHYCSQCSEPGCGGKIGTNRCFIIEKILTVALFKCEFNCAKGPFSSSEFRIHVKRCHLRPFKCAYCNEEIQFRKYLDHLISFHNVREANMVDETTSFCFSLIEGLPRVQFSKMNDVVILFRYENSKFWVEILSEDEDGEADYTAKVQGLKYDIDTKLQCLHPRVGYDTVTSCSGDNVSRLSISSSAGDFKSHVNPPIDETLYVVITLEDDNSISSAEYFEFGDFDSSENMPSYIKSVVKDTSFLLAEKRSSLDTTLDGDWQRRTSQMSTTTIDVESDADSAVFHIGSLFPSRRTIDRSSPVDYVPSQELAEKHSTKRQHVLNEIITTERDYVTAMFQILDGYGEDVTQSDPELFAILPTQLLKYAHKFPAPVTDTGIGNLTLSYNENLFGNLGDLYKFHSKIFLPQLEEAVETIEKLGFCFTENHEALLVLYSRYCQMMPAVRALQQEIGEDHPWLDMCRRRLNHKLRLDSYLMKPIQRITKYQLLLKDLIKCSEGCPGYPHLIDALDCMLRVLRSVDESMLQLSIVDYPYTIHEEGLLQFHGSFQLWTEQDKYRTAGRFRHLFLYPKSILVCKKYRDSLHFKGKINLMEYGLTEKPAGENPELRFELWTRGRVKTYLIQAESPEMKQQWVGAINKILMEQLQAAVKSRKHSTLSASRSTSLNNNGITMNVVTSI